MHQVVIVLGPGLVAAAQHDTEGRHLCHDDTSEELTWEPAPCLAPSSSPSRVSSKPLRTTRRRIGRRGPGGSWGRLELLV